MTDWKSCPAVERRPGKISGAWAFKGTRVPVYAFFENFAGGATIDEFVEWFPGHPYHPCPTPHLKYPIAH